MCICLYVRHVRVSRVYEYGECAAYMCHVRRGCASVCRLASIIFTIFACEKIASLRGLIVLRSHQLYVSPNCLQQTDVERTQRHEETLRNEIELLWSFLSKQ